MLKKIIVLSMLVSLSAYCIDEQPVKPLGEQVNDSVDAIKEGAENIVEGKNPLKEKGPAEKAGEYIDEKATEAKEAVIETKDNMLNKGAAEKAGEKIDEAKEAVTE